MKSTCFDLAVAREMDREGDTVECESESERAVKGAMTEPRQRAGEM